MFRCRWIIRLFIAAVCMSAIGCGDTPGTRLQVAKMALERGNPQKALHESESLLKSLPQNREAMFIKAKSQLLMARLEDSRSSLDRLLEYYPDDLEARRLFVNWALFRLKDQLQKTDFLANPHLQEQFNDALEVGRRQAGWLSLRNGHEAEALYTEARLVSFEVAQIEKKVASYKQDAIRRDRTGDKQDPQVVSVVGHLNQRIGQLKSSAEHFLRDAISLKPDHYDACQIYAWMLRGRNAWSEIWALSQQLVKRKDLPALLGERLAIDLLSMPETVQASHLRIETGWKLLGAVSQQEAKSDNWYLASTRLRMAEGRYPESLEMVEHVLRNNNKHVNGRYLKAQTLYGLKRYEDAKNILDELTTERPATDEVMVFHALTLIETGNQAQAMGVLQRVRARNPDNRFAEKLWIELMGAEGLLGEVFEDLENYYRDNPTDTAAIRLMVQFLRETGKRDRLRHMLDREVQMIDPLGMGHLRVLIGGYFYLKDYDAAERFARRLVRVDGEVLASHLLLAEALLMLGQDKQVKSNLESLRRRFGQTASVDQMMGRLYLRRQSFDRAAELLERVVQMQPDNVDAMLLLAQAYASLSLTDDALEQVDLVLQERPNSLRGHALAARIFHFMRQEEKAKAHLAHIAEADLDVSKQPALLAQIKFSQGKNDEALEICNRAIGAGATDPTLRLIISNIHLYEKRYGEAEQQLWTLLENVPGNVYAHRLLTQFYISQRQFAAGINAYRRVQWHSGGEMLAHLSVAALQHAAGQADAALNTLSTIYEPLVKAGQRRALVVADAMSAVYQRSKDLTMAMDVYQRLVEADFYRGWAILRQVNLLMQLGERDRAVEFLDNLAATLNTAGINLQHRLLSQYGYLGHEMKALSVVGGWIAQYPDNVNYLKWKSELLLKMGHGSEAEKVLVQAIRLAPNSVTLHRYLAQAKVIQLDYPAAVKVMGQMGELDSGAKIASLVAQGELCLSIGLTNEAVRTFGELELAGKAQDPRILFAVGKAEDELGHSENAISRLSRIPAHAMQYAAAQVYIAKVDQRLGRIERARERLESLLDHPQSARNAALELLKLNLRDKQHEAMLAWVERALAVDWLPDHVKAQWLKVKITVNANRGQWEDVARTLAMLANLKSDSPEIALARIVVLHWLNRIEKAAQIYRATPALAQMPLGPLVAMLVDEQVEQTQSELALSRYLRALCVADIPAARDAVPALEPRKTLFKSDLLKILDQYNAKDVSTRKAAKSLARGLIALEVGLPQMAKEQAERVVGDMPAMLPAYGFLVQAQLDLLEPIDGTLGLVHRNVPNSALGAYLAARASTKEKKWEDAIKGYAELLEREPGNVHAEYHLTHALHRSGDFDGAMASLKKIVIGNGPYRALAGNDLAYLLAEHQPDGLEEAYAVAKQALAIDSGNPAIFDTIGWIEHKRGRNEIARTLLTRGVMGLGDMGDVHYHLGVVYQALGNVQWGKYHLVQAANSNADEAVVKNAQRVLATLLK